MHTYALPNKEGKPELHVAIETHHCARPIHVGSDEGAMLEQKFALPRIPVDLKNNFNSRFAVGCQGYKITGIPMKGQEISFKVLACTGARDTGKLTEIICVW